ELGRQGRADGLGRQSGGGDAGADRWPERARDHHLDRLLAPPGIAARPAGELHEADPEVGSWFIRPVERERNVHSEEALLVAWSERSAVEHRLDRQCDHRLRDERTRRGNDPAAELLTFFGG